MLSDHGWVYKMHNVKQGDAEIPLVMRWYSENVFRETFLLDELLISAPTELIGQKLGLRSVIYHYSAISFILVRFKVNQDLSIPGTLSVWQEYTLYGTDTNQLQG